METIYKGYTIEEDHAYNPYRKEPYYCFYPTSEGRQDDADYDGESFVYCGNAKWESTLQEAKDAIDEITGDYELPSVTFIGERLHNGKLIRIYRADSGSDQYRFANLFNGRPVDETHLILMVERVDPTQVFNMVAQAIAEPIRQAN